MGASKRMAGAGRSESEVNDVHSGLNPTRVSKEIQVGVTEDVVRRVRRARMEKRSDLLLSTLREYTTALGGRLELRAVFPDGDFEIEPLAPLKAAKKGPNQITAPSKRTVGSRR